MIAATLLSTPSLGITRGFALVGQWCFDQSFNSLSRDHTLLSRGNRARKTSMLSTPSLGITKKRKKTVVLSLAFNSLSRDHVALPCGRYGHTLRLSTPSLGITDALHGLADLDHVDFQLPLSGSRRASCSDRHLPETSILSTPSLGITSAPVRGAGEGGYIFFQLPLSGSHDVRVARPEVVEGPLSTPSLGITSAHSGVKSTLLISDFQLPLSGSPSPIPGFSGSPRRSAAAPLRTNDF